MKIREKNNGITLIALVVTIVVLLTLAGITINLAFDNNGIIKRVQNAIEEHNAVTQKEQQAIKDVDDAIFTITSIIKVNKGEKAFANGTIDGKVPNAYNPIIPKGYYPIETDTTTWGSGVSKPNPKDVDNGLVITDNLNDGNEWVWIPIENPSELYEKLSEPVMIGYEVNAKTDKYTKSEILEGKIRGIPNGGENFEPGINNTFYFTDIDEEKRLQAGFKTLEEMGEKLTNDYNDMIKSIEKYHGFYIGRYELSEEGTKKNKNPLTNLNWHQLYARCNSHNASENVETRMMWGLQIDAICKWISNNEDNKNINDSSNWGNFNNSKSPANIKGYGTKQKTGYSEYWKVKNIYDFAGNVGEYTQECTMFSTRKISGGSSIEKGENKANFYNELTNDQFEIERQGKGSNNVSTRITLYIK